jgi:uncharacterized oligopeptide transporter (OPT) family protein
MGLNARTWITFFVLALLMGVNNVYSTLLTGWGDGGSIVAVILCLLFLPSVGSRIHTYNLGQTIASSGGSVGFTVAILGSVYYWHISKGEVWTPPLVPLALLVMAVSLMGVLVAIPLRRYIVHWFFPSAVACATILRTVTSTDEAARKRASMLMGGGGALSALLTLPTKIALTPGGHALWSSITLPKGLGLSLDPLLYGIGIVVGTRIGLSMLAGSLLTQLVYVPRLVAAEAPVGDYIRWTAVGLMTLPAFASMAFAFFLKSKRDLPPGFDPVDRDAGLTTRDWAMLGGAFLVAMIIAIVTMNMVFGVSWIWVVAGVALGGPLCVALGKVASETDINPVRLLAIILLFVFSLFGTHTAPALLGMGIGGAALASIAVDLFYDLRTGYLVNANPRHQMILQLMGVIPAAFVCVFFLHMLASRFGIGPDTQFPAPGAVIWATMADGFASGGTDLPSGIWKALAITSVVGVVLSLLENWKPTRAFTPSSFALGIALLLPFEMCAAIFLGSAARFLAVTIARARGGAEAEQRVTDDSFQFGSAVFAAAALTGIVAVLLITFGVVHLPADH